MFGELKEERKLMCLRILRENVEVISGAIHCYWQNHMQEIRHSLTTKNA